MNLLKASFCHTDDVDHHATFLFSINVGVHPVTPFVVVNLFSSHKSFGLD